MKSLEVLKFAVSSLYCAQSILQLYIKYWRCRDEFVETTSSKNNWMATHKTSDQNYGWHLSSYCIPTHGKRWWILVEYRYLASNKNNRDWISVSYYHIKKRRAVHYCSFYLINTNYVRFCLRLKMTTVCPHNEMSSHFERKLENTSNPSYLNASSRTRWYPSWTSCVMRLKEKFLVKTCNFEF